MLAVPSVIESCINLLLMWHYGQLFINSLSNLLSFFCHSVYSVSYKNGKKRNKNFTENFTVFFWLNLSKKRLNDQMIEWVKYKKTSCTAGCKSRLRKRLRKCHTQTGGEFFVNVSINFAIKYLPLLI